MAIQISGTTVITNQKNIINTENGNFTGIVTAFKFVGNGVDIQNKSIGLLYTLGQ
jgi:hypothetical protein